MAKIPRDVVLKVKLDKKELSHIKRNLKKCIRGFQMALDAMEDMPTGDAAKEEFEDGQKSE